MRSEVTARPINSIVFLSDPGIRADIPDYDGASLVVATSTCLAVGTASEVDGDTTIRLGDDVSGSGVLVFDGVLLTPGRAVAISDAEANELMSTAVTGEETRITIWADDLVEPSLIEIRAL